MDARRINRAAIALAAIALGGVTVSTYAAEVTWDRLLNAEGEPGNWMMYHGTFKSWHYSALEQINTANVHRLQEAWSHVASRANRGLQSFPLAIDGVLYYSSPYNQVYALDGATGQMLWTYKQKLNEDLVAKQTHSPYNRGIAAGYGNIYMGTLDGKLVAIDMKSGKLAWETKLVNSEKLTVGFTGAPLVVKDKVIIGAQGGEWPYRGPLFGVDAKSGKQVWQFLTVGGNEGTPTDKRDTWGNDSWKTGGGGGWMAGGYDPDTNTVWWGTGNPAPLYDWAGDKWQTEGLPSGNSARRLGLRLGSRRVHDGRKRRQEICRASGQERLGVGLRPHGQSAERLPRCGQHQFREGHHQDGRAHRTARPGRR